MDNNEETKVEEVQTTPVEVAPVEETKVESTPVKETKKVSKGNVVKYLLIIVGCLLAGTICGAYLVKALNTNVKNDTFMYDILKGSGLLTNNTVEVDVDDIATPIDYATDTCATQGVDQSLLGATFIKSKGDWDYYYLKTAEGDYLYYYTYKGGKVLFYYASDSNGNHMKETYKDQKPALDVNIDNWVGSKYKDVESDINEWWDSYNIQVLFVKNDSYPEGTVYYQSLVGKQKIQYFTYNNEYEYPSLIIMVNDDEPTNR